MKTITVHDVVRILKSERREWTTKQVADALGSSAAQTRRRLDVARIYDYANVKNGPRGAWLWTYRAPNKTHPGSASHVDGHEPSELAGTWIMTQPED